MKQNFKVKIEKLGGEGVGIGNIDGKIIFVPYSVPGDELLVKIIHETKSYYRGKIIEILNPSPERINPKCKYFELCGGCSHQNINYNAQLKHKQNLICEIFHNYIKNGTLINEIIPSPLIFEYRNKLQMQCGQTKDNQLMTGFYKPKSHDIVFIDYCPLHSKSINDIIKLAVSTLNKFNIKAYNEKTKKGTLRHIVVREGYYTKELMMTFVSNHKTILNQNKISKILFSKNNNLKSLFLFHNPHDTNVIFEDGSDIKFKDNRSPLTKIYGEDFIIDNILNTKFKISPLSFFQVNTLQAENIAKHISDVIDENVTTICSLIDAYSGIGTLSLHLTNKFEHILAVEIVEHACTLARLNAKTLNSKNYHVRHGDAPDIIEKHLKKIGINEFQKKYKFIILDPPRAGLDEKMCEFLCNILIPNLIYVSCNPYTLKRDIDYLCNKGNYKLIKITPFDMFPHTFHIECMALLKK